MLGTTEEQLMTHAQQNAYLQRKSRRDRKSGKTARRHRRILALVRKYKLTD
jgi:hypothetical protein